MGGVGGVEEPRHSPVNRLRYIDSNISLSHSHTLVAIWLGQPSNTIIDLGLASPLPGAFRKEHNGITSWVSVKDL